MDSENLKTIVDKLIAKKKQEAIERDAKLCNVLSTTQNPAQDERFVDNILEFTKSWRALETMILNERLLSTFVEIYTAFIKEEKRQTLPSGIDISAVSVFLPDNLADRFTVLSNSNLMEAILHQGISLSKRGQKLLEDRYPELHKRFYEKAINFYM